MLKPGLSRWKTRAAALYMVIGTLVIVSILAKVIVTVILNQATISRHHSGRIQAYYAAKAGMNYALEKLRTGQWRYSTSPAVNDCPPTAVGTHSACDVSETEFPASISSLGTGAKEFRVVFCPASPLQKCAPRLDYCIPPAGYDFCIQVSVKYTAPDVPT
jgi:Tfp pilus assembly protein PilX